MSEASGSHDLFSSQISGAESGRLSLPSTSGNGAVPRHDQQQLLSSCPRPPASGEEGEELEAAGESPRPPESAEDAGDDRSRRIIRNQYRELIYNVQRKAGGGGRWLPQEPQGRRPLPGPGVAGPLRLRRGWLFIPGRWGLRGVWGWVGQPFRCRAGSLKIFFEELLKLSWALVSSSDCWNLGPVVRSKLVSLEALASPGTARLWGIYRHFTCVTALMQRNDQL